VPAGVYEIGIPRTGFVSTTSLRDISPAQRVRHSLPTHHESRVDRLHRCRRLQQTRPLHLRLDQSTSNAERGESAVTAGIYEVDPLAIRDESGGNVELVEQDLMSRKLVVETKPVLGIPIS